MRVISKGRRKTEALVVILSLMMIGADPELPKSFSVDSVLHLRKSTNHNQVHYAVRVDEACRPFPEDPVRAYWRMLEIGENETEELRFWEQPGYGVRQPGAVVRGDTGGHFDFQIRGVPERLIRVESFRSKGECRARAFTQIAQGRALFEYIAISVSGWANVHLVEIFGTASDGKAVREVTFRED
jgi:hypothetical protein